MEPDQVIALLDAEAQEIRESRAIEEESRNALSNVITAEISALYPGASLEFLASNAHFSNELARGAGELADKVAASTINWTGPVQDTDVTRLFTKELVRLLVTEALVTAKLALYPRVNEGGRLEFEVLTGFLHPVFSPTNALRVDAVLQVIPVRVDGVQRFEVRKYSPGMVEVYPPVEDWMKFSAGVPLEIPQPHARDRLPLSFIVTRRDAHRQPFGIVSEALGAFRRYIKSAVNRNAVQEIAGWPERVVKSDKYLTAALDGRGGAQHPAVTALKQVGPRQLKLIGSGDSYEVTTGADPTPHILAEETDKVALLDLLRSPDIAGGNLTEVAIAERQAKHRAFIEDMCGSIADLVTDACALASALPGSKVGAGIVASLTPRFAVDLVARGASVVDAFSKSAIPASVVLTELQALYPSITDEMVDAAKRREAADLEVPELTNEDTLPADPPAADPEAAV